MPHGSLSALGPSLNGSVGDAAEAPLSPPHGSVLASVGSDAVSQGSEAAGADSSTESPLHGSVFVGCEFATESFEVPQGSLVARPLSSVGASESPHGQLLAGGDVFSSDKPLHGSSFALSTDSPQRSLEPVLESWDSFVGAPQGSFFAAPSAFGASAGAPQGSELDGAAAVAACSHRSGSESPSFA